MLRLRRPNGLTQERKPVDIFFSALAEDQGEYAVGVILSGGDSDGTLGAKAIKERGGLTVAQAHDGYGPRNPDMPQSAIASGLVDVAVPAEEIGAKLEAFARGFDTLKGLAEEDGDHTADIDKVREQIYAILRSHSGHDFSGYKTKTFLRRVKRRMQIAQVHSISAYIDWLKKDAREVMNLFRDLLINVTNFFRDPDAFEFSSERSYRSCSKARPPVTPSGSGFPDAPPARRCSPSASCCANTWRRLRSFRASRYLPPT